MTERDIVDLWKHSVASGDAVYLATVVFAEGSSYRKPGARMLVTGSGQRAGTISGGCLEAEVAKKIAWLTSNGPVIQEYKSSFDDDAEGVSYGLGCGGTIWILMEAGREANATLQAMDAALVSRKSFAVVASLHSRNPGTRAVLPLNVPESGTMEESGDLPEDVLSAARQISTTRQTRHLHREESSALPRYIVMPILPPLRVHIFGGGDDAVPLVRFAAELGWEVTVWDGRSHLLRPARFPAAELRLISYQGEPERGNHLRVIGELPEIAADDFAVVLTHSYAQDGALLQILVPKHLPYLGILGPLHRTRRLLSETVDVSGETVDTVLQRLYAPVGLDIGSNEPTAIALSIVAEMQAVLSRKQYGVSRR
ncbi:MAG: XdhC family protein [Terriglobus sp.]